MDAFLLAQKARISSLEAEMQGMIALNQFRMSRDETIAYDDEQFQAISNELNDIYQLIVSNT